MNEMKDWDAPVRPAKKTFDRKSFIKTFLYSGLAFGVWMAIVFGFVSGWQAAIPTGIGAGLFFGLSMAGFTAILGKRMSGRLALRSGEEVLKEGPASHFFKGESVGGWLTLTDQRLQFTSHKINVQVHTLDLQLSQIARAETVATARLIPNGLKIKTASGESEHFVVNGRADWVNTMAKAKHLRI